MNTVLCRTSGESRRRIGFRCVWLAAACLLAATRLSAADYTYVRISVPGSVETWANGINARGDIVGLYHTADGGPFGYVLRNGVYTTIATPPGAAGLAPRRINSRGDIAGIWHEFDGGTHGFLLSDGQVTRIQRPNSSFTWVFGLNDAGDVVGFSDPGSFLLRDGKFRTVPSGGVRGVEYRMFDVRDNGRVLVGTAISNEGITGFISRRHGEVEVIEYPLPGACTAIRGMNERGDMVGAVATDDCFPPFGDARGFVLRDGEFTPIHPPGAQGSDAWDINDDGVIVGRYLDTAGHIVGFKARPNR